MLSKRLIPILMVLVMLTTLMSCGGGKSKDQSTAAETAATSEEKAAEPQNVEIKLVKLDNPDTASENDLVFEEIRKKFLKDTNIDVKFTIDISPWDTSHEMYVQKFAAGDRMDAILTHSGIIDTIVRADKEALKPIDEWLPQYAPKYFELIPQDGWNENKRFGKIVGLPYERLPALYIMAGRTDILVDKWGLNIKPETLADLEALFAAIKEKDPKSVPLTGAYWAIMRLVMAYADIEENYAWGPPISVFLDSDGQVKPLIFHKNYPVMGEMLAKWVKNGWVPKEVIGINNVDADKFWFSGKSYLKADYYSLPLDTNLKEFQKTEPNAKVEMIGVPKSINGTPQLHGETSFNIQWCLPSTGEESSQIAFLKYIDWMVSDPANYRLANYGIEGKYFRTEGDLQKPIYRDANGNEVTDQAEIEKIIKKQAEENFLPYRAMYSVFQTERSGYKSYAATTPATIIECEKFLNSVQKTKFVLEGKIVFDMSVNDIGTKKTDAENAVTTLIAEILTGVKPLSELEKAKKLYLDNGGQEVIDELTKQYNEFTK